MSDLWLRLLHAAESAQPAVFSADWLGRWAPDEVERCLACGLLQPAEPAAEVTCRECGEVEEVLYLAGDRLVAGQAYTRCALAGPVPVGAERLQRWEVRAERLPDMLLKGVPMRASPEQIVPGRIWFLGKTRWAGALRGVYFGRALHRSDADRVIDRAGLSSQSVLFVPARAPHRPAAALPCLLDHGHHFLLQFHRHLAVIL